MIERFIECLVPISKCNLKCEYCYVIQESRRNEKTPEFALSPSEIGKAFCQERWGGQCLVNLCGYGETLLCKELPEIAYYILKQGHIVNITNNGTVTSAIKEILSFPDELLKNVIFAFSLHYDELKNRKLLNTFANNVISVKNSRASFLVQLNLCDSYIEKRQEIKCFCMSNFGALPQVALTREESNGYKIMTTYSAEEYYAYGQEFQSPLFEFTYQKFLEKRTEFCYAGDKSFKLNLATGELKRCYFELPFFNVYENIDSEIPFKPIGRGCGMAYCINASHFMSLGIVPEVPCSSYVELRDRSCAGWYKENIQNALNGKFVCQDYESIFQSKWRDKKFYIFGAGIAGKEIVQYCKKSNWKIEKIVVTNKEENPKVFLGIPVIGMKEVLNEETEVIHFIVAIKNSLTRKKLIKEWNLPERVKIIEYGEFEPFLECVHGRER